MSRIAWNLSRAILVMGLFCADLGMAWAQADQHVDVIEVTGVIDPLVAQYVARGIGIAEGDGARCLIILLDTPGGLDTAMRDIVRRMLNTAVPVVVYVSPSGARAGSAGVFITLAAHVAAMAPGTNIGAAHPVAMGEELPATLNAKATNDAAAYIRSIARQRGHNADWAEQAVRESVSITEREALEKGVVDLVATDLDDLLGQLDGRQIAMPAGPLTLHTEGVTVRMINMNLQEIVLHTLIDPNIAYLLFTIGIWALIAEFYHPGAILPGITGAICLILAFVAFGSLPVNWGGIALIILAIILFILDIKVTGFALSVGGAIAFALGSLMLFSPFAPPSPTMPPLAVSRPLIGVMTVLLSGFFIFALSAGLRAQRVAPVSGMATMIGITGRATSDLAPVGTVLVRSEDWTAEAVNGPIRAGEEVKVIGVEGVRLKVRKEGKE